MASGFIKVKGDSLPEKLGIIFNEVAALVAEVADGGEVSVRGQRVEADAGTEVGQRRVERLRPAGRAILGDRPGRGAVPVAPGRVRTRYA